MTTTTTVTCGSGGDYSTPQTADDAAPADLQASDIIWRVELLQSFSYSSSGIYLTIAADNQDATRYKVFAPAAGLGFKDHASKLTNALKGNAANGIAITGSGHSYGNPIVHALSGHSRLEGLQIIDTAGSNGGVIRGVKCFDCIIEGNSVGSNLALIRDAQSMTNTVVILRSSTSSAGGIVNVTGNSPVFTNCTFVVPSDFTAAQYGVTCNYSSASTFKNCAIFGVGAVGLNLGGTTFTNCYTNVASPPSGCTQVAYDTSTGSGFEGITDAARDFRIKTTSALKDNGTATGAPAADIVGTTRTAPIDVGAWEFTGGGGGSTDVAANNSRYALNSRNAYGLRR